MKLIEALEYKPVELSFGTSGLRALVSDMTDLECYINATGFLRFLQTKENLKPGSKIYVAGDLRDSSPKITAVMVSAITNAGYEAVYCGKIPTPALAYYAGLHRVPCIMVTGSHIPADRNGIKFYKTAGELMKDEETPMREHVAATRVEIYEQSSEESIFDNHGNLKTLPAIPPIEQEADRLYLKRYTDVFPSDCLAGKQIVVYQHSAVGRDLLVELFTALGAQTVGVERSETFIPIDTEHIRNEDKLLFNELSQKYPHAFAIVSTDGDSDRPFVVDETGIFHSGDVLGAVVADYLHAKFAAIVVSSNDAVDTYLQEHKIAIHRTKIGSPHVIAAMRAADPSLKPHVSWETNGGFLTGDDIQLGGGSLKALPTRDAALPIICALLSASQKNFKLSELFAALPKRFTSASLIDVRQDQADKFRELANNTTAIRQVAAKIFGDSELGDIKDLNTIDGLRLIFDSGDVVHLRPSGNAPQFRVYTNTDSQSRADELAARATSSGGYIEQLLAAL